MADKDTCQYPYNGSQRNLCGVMRFLHGPITNHKFVHAEVRTCPTCNGAGEIPIVPADVVADKALADYPERYILAIKVVREKTGVDLRTAKDAVDRAKARLPFKAAT